MQISHGLALIKLKLKKYLGNKNKQRVLYLINIDFRMPVHYIRPTLNIAKYHQTHPLGSYYISHKQ